MSAQHRVPVILTRALAQAKRFATTLPEGAAPVFSPLLRIDFLPSASLPQATETLIFTSENGVDALKSTGGGHPGQVALCVGDRTAARAEVAGFAAQSAKGSAEDLIGLASEHTGPFVHVRGTHTRGAIASSLRERGKPCRELVLYSQIAEPLAQEAVDVLTSGAPCLVPLFSPRTAGLFQQACPRAAAAQVICISPAVADELVKGAYGSIIISTAPNAESLRTALCGRLRAIQLETGGSSG